MQLIRRPYAHYWTAERRMVHVVDALHLTPDLHAVVCQVNEEILKSVPAERLIAAMKVDGEKSIPEHFSNFAELKVMIVIVLSCLTCLR